MTHRRSDGNLGAARAYHPRGRTVRERNGGTGNGAAPRTTDSLRSALQVFDEPDQHPGDEHDDLRNGNRRSRSGGSQRPAAPRKPPAPRKPAPQPRPAASKPAKSSKTGKPGKPAKPAKVAKPANAAKPAKMAKPTKAAKSARPRSTRPPNLGSPPRRLRLATVLALSLFAVLGLRLIELQLTDGPAFAAAGLQNRLQEMTLPAERGAIYDRNGEVLAHSVEARYVYADPVLLTDPQAAAGALQPLLGIPVSELADRMRPTQREDGIASRFEYLARGVDTDTAKQVEALELPGIFTARDERRLVPGNDLAANLIGFTREDMVGLEGLEAAYDDLLRGVDGKRIYEAGQGASRNRPIPGGYERETAAQPGRDLRLTIDMDLQYEVQSVLADRLRAAGAEFGAAVVLDPHTGEVLAQASYPTYNAADPLSAPPEHRTDAATVTVFDPGSAHKPLVFGAALEEGVIAPGDTVTVGPTIVKGDQVFSDTTPQPAGTELTLPAALAYSSNVGTIKIADGLGKEKLYEYQQAFGLGAATGVGLPGEAAGALLAPADWYGSSHGSVPIGHSVSVTTLQLAAAYGSIANDGEWVSPALVQQTGGDPQTRRVLSPENAAYLRELMEAVVTMPGATGLGAAVDRYRVAGKTGTGKLVVDGEYAPGEVSSFVGMAPAQDPRYVVAVVAYPGTGDLATGAFREMMAYALNHYAVPPDGSEPPAFTPHP